MKKIEEEEDTRPGRPHMKPDVENPLDSATGFLAAAAIAPVAGAAAAGITAYKIMKGEKKKKVGVSKGEENREEDL